MPIFLPFLFPTQLLSVQVVFFRWTPVSSFPASTYIFLAQLGLAFFLEELWLLLQGFLFSAVSEMPFFLPPSLLLSGESESP